MFIPIRTDRPARRRPVVVEALIVLNLAAYLTGFIGHSGGWFSLEQFLDFGALDPAPGRFKPWQLVTSLFLHDPSSIWHLAFNMLFLWVFGVPVEDRMAGGRLGFLGFYLVGGIVAGAAHMMISKAPVIGASGAIAGVTGAFLALFPRSRIIVLYFLGFIGVLAVPALWFIGLYFVVDVLRQSMELLGGHAGGVGGVAYMAHIAGYVYGFAMGFLLLAIGMIKREEYDVFFLFTQAKRRAAFRAANRDSASGAWESASADTGKRLEAKRKAERPPTEDELREVEIRTEINRLLTDHRLSEAAAKYRQLLQEFRREAGGRGAVLSEHRQLDVANQLLAEQDFANAATAYELLLERYPGTTRSAEVRLLLGTIYARQLHKLERAREVIEQARGSLRDAGQIALANALLAEIEGGVP